MTQQQLEPFYEDVQAHYDLSNEFFTLFLDPTMMYSCAYFERDGMTLEEAQLAKVDLSLGKCDLKRGQLLLDIGCGWGTSSLRAAEKHGVDVIGLTLSRNQHAWARSRMGELPPGSGNVEFRLQGWEEYEGAVDRIVSIAAFEAFRIERYDAFFRKCFDLMPADGRMLLHTIVCYTVAQLEEKGIEVNHENVLFGKFIREEIFPGGQLVPPERVCRHAAKAGFEVAEIQSLRSHYVRTLEIWAAHLEAAKERAVEIKGDEVYNRYMKYLTGCADHFRSGHIDVMQFTLAKP